MSNVKPFPKRPKKADRPPEQVTVQASVYVGQYPEAHAQAGKFAIQIMIAPFDTRELANAMVDMKVIPLIEGALGMKALVTQ